MPLRVPVAGKRGVVVYERVMILRCGGREAHGQSEFAHGTHAADVDNGRGAEGPPYRWTGYGM